MCMAKSFNSDACVFRLAQELNIPKIKYNLPFFFFSYLLTIHESNSKLIPQLKSPPTAKLSIRLSNPTVKWFPPDKSAEIRSIEEKVSALTFPKKTAKVFGAPPRSAQHIWCVAYVGLNLRVQLVCNSIFCTSVIAQHASRSVSDDGTYRRRESHLCVGTFSAPVPMSSPLSTKTFTNPVCTFHFFHIFKACEIIRIEVIRNHLNFFSRKLLLCLVSIFHEELPVNTDTCWQRYLSAGFTLPPLLTLFWIPLVLFGVSVAFQAPEMVELYCKSITPEVATVSPRIGLCLDFCLLVFLFCVEFSSLRDSDGGTDQGPTRVSFSERPQTQIFDSVLWTAHLCEFCSGKSAVKITLNLKYRSNTWIKMSEQTGGRARVTVRGPILEGRAESLTGSTTGCLSCGSALVGLSRRKFAVVNVSAFGC